MSFGLGIGDFLAVIKLAEKIRKRFNEAPSQFNAISDEVRSLSHVLHDCEVDLSIEELSDKQKKNLLEIEESCYSVLLEIEKTIARYSQLEDNQNSKIDKAKRVWRRLKWEPADISDLRSRVTSTVVILNAFIGGVTQSNVSKLVQHQQSQEDREILDWLSSEAYATQQSDHISRRQEGTGEWLLESPEFQAWISTPKATLFCPGIPGAGKTIMAAAVIEELNDLHGNNSDVGIAYFYCNYHRPDEEKPANLLASLLRQLAQGQSTLPDSLKTLHDQHRRTGTRPTLAEISKALNSVASRLSQLFIVLDALDECEISPLSRDKVLDVIFDLQSKYNLNILATSRFLPDIVERFTGKPSREISASSHDVKRYLEENVASLPRCVLTNPELQKEIITGIIATVDGMFLLAKLYLDSLIGKKSPKAIRTALAKLSKGSDAYEAAYNGAMERIQGQHPEQKNTALEVLSWITCAKRQLTTIELQTALAVEIGESEFDCDNMPDLADMVSVCAGLVTVDEQGGIVRLVHYTTQEYFTRTWQRWFPDAHVQLSRVCITYLSFDEFAASHLPSEEDKRFNVSDVFEARFDWKDHALYPYAARNWHTHDWVRAMGENKLPGFVVNQRKLVTYSSWFHTEGPHGIGGSHGCDASKRTTGLHLAAKLGLEEMARQLQQSIPIDFQDSLGRTSLSYAAEYGHESVAKLLIEKDADIEFRGAESNRTALEWASLYGHGNVVSLLLEHGVNVGGLDCWSRTPLSSAVDNGNETVVRLLLDHGIDPNYAHPETGMVPLSYAAWNGHEALVRVLLEKGADAEPRSPTAGRTPLLWAAKYNHVPVVKLLHENGADIDSRSQRVGLNALSYAAKNGYEALARLLLKNGVDPNSADNAGRTPLSWAAQNKHSEEKKFVCLGHRPDLDDAHNEDGTPKHRGEKNFVCLGYRPDLYDAHNEDGTPKHQVSERRSGEEVARILLEQGADPDSTDKAGRTPLSWAAQKGNEPMIQLLLENGADPNLGDNDGRTPLAWAAEREREETVKILLENGANLNSMDNYGQTPLSWAEKSRPYWSTEIPTAVVKNLLEYGADPNLATGFKYSEFIRSAKSINAYEWDACSTKSNCTESDFDMC
ncbi:hypothetical protein N7499_010572 [Penicillium canescens]|uniref:NACHT domain-containing protein n=1 Tax=Penicillium canescens TaxID=5083 RepID=A0AAD6NBY9_PENCN|nr:uncharacterized protein N7446_005840 [Penicillium canescens]KAJ6051209.1 hypothetical protein N7460_001743 [Penicillium canescens]KAJ6061720.1 hypothetical protein N7446_005840 [Penicillium canescens]KAJ6064969.1 hypothetical protein N7444_000622 [Penicillium canescens]KAJ6068685.1 hypothetical protein N7499_010572 [Penicillium canescens]KAJ6183261.1 hypothetical protein N7485_001903 [Penicillium canescens]